MSALGALFGGGGPGGDPSQGDPSGGDAGQSDQLLQQILDLMTQYLALGPDTPAYQPVSEALPAIQEAAGQGAPNPDAATAADDPMAGGDSGSPMDSMQPSSPPSSFGDASTQALDALKKRGKGKGY